MKTLKYLALAAVAALFFAAAPAKSCAQVSVTIGPAPVCPYGYYDYAPYACAPYGYYGPTWFVNGIFIGAGPWYHGPAHFYGRVNNHYDPRRGYHGPTPARGEAPAPGHAPGQVAHFKGNESRDGRGGKR